MSYKVLVFFCICRFAVVVQNSGGVSTFYATCETDVIKRKVWLHHKYRDHMNRDEGMTVPKCRNRGKYNYTDKAVMVTCNKVLLPQFHLIQFSDNISSTSKRPTTQGEIKLQRAFYKNVRGCRGGRAKNRSS